MSKSKKYRKAIESQYTNMLERRKRNARKHSNLLPDDLAENIIENGKKELKELNKKIKNAEKEIEKIKELRKENRQKRKEALEIIPRSKTVTGFDGEEKTIELEPIVRSNQETLKYDHAYRRLWKLMKRWERHLQYLKGLRSDTIKVIDEAKKGAFSAVFKIVKHWENRPITLGPVSRVVQDDKIFTDAAGNPTPDGKPINAGIPAKPNK